MGVSLTAKFKKNYCGEPQGEGKGKQTFTKGKSYLVTTAFLKVLKEEGVIETKESKSK
jgi:hypothetical protein